MGRVLLKVPFLYRPSPAPTHTIQPVLKVIILGDSGSVHPLAPILSPFPSSSLTIPRSLQRR
jgi:hypothetical protein